MPRSWHSFTSYFNCMATGSPHLLQNVGVFLLKVPHLRQMRSEEHTSELQSRLHLVCRLLLEKKNVARKLTLGRKRSSQNVLEMAATEPITSIILIKLIRVSLGTVRHPRRFKIVVIDIQITLKQMLRDFIGIRVNRANIFFMVNITSSVTTLPRRGIIPI